MNKFVKVSSAVAIALGLGMGNAYAQNSLRNGSFALNMQISDSAVSENVFVTDPSPAANNVESPLMIGGKFMLSSKSAVVLGFGLGIHGGDGSGTDVAIKGGYRSYMKTADFAPFLGGFFAMKSYNDGDISETYLMGELGAEYFLNSKFSVEGSAYVGHGSVKFDNGTTSATDTRLGTYGTTVSVNYYF